MKIIYFNTLYAPNIGGGAEVTLQQQVESLHGNGHQVLVVCLGPEKGIVRDTVNGVSVVRLGLPNMYFPLLGERRPPTVQRLLWHWRDQDNAETAKQLASIIDDFAPDVASCHNLAGLSISIWHLLVSHNVPIVQVLHDQYLLCPKTTMVKDGNVCQQQCMDCRILRRNHAVKSNSVDVVVGVSKYIVEKMRAAGYFGSSVTLVINNVRRADLWSGELIARPRAADRLTFGFIGGITPIKGIERLLEAFIGASLGDHCQLVIAGRGEGQYVAELQSKYVDTRIVWLGYAKPVDFFSKIDVLVVPSIWHDTFPGVVFEAFGFGVPVLGSNRGGIPEMIVSEVNGYLFDPEAVGELEKQLKSIATNMSIICTLSNGAIASAFKYQDTSSWVRAYENAYQKAIDKRNICALI